MKLSILDQSPISSGKTAQEALHVSIQLAQAAEQFGYTRYWIAEHHDLPGLACPNPDVMLSYIGAKTNHIRIGAGAVLLPHYKPFKVAETYNLLATLFPGRIDLGIGRAPGGSAEVSIALSGNYLKNVKEMPQSLTQLLHFLHQNFPEDDIYSKITPAPVPEKAPEVWLLGTSEKSAILAAERGLPYVFGHFMSDANGPLITKTYRNQFKKTFVREKPQTIVTITAICAERTDLAEELALSYFVWNLSQINGENKTVPSIEEAKAYSFTAEDKGKIQKMKQKMVIGNPQEVAQQIRQLQTIYQADEIMIVTITHSYEAKIKSYKYIARELL